MAFVKIQRIRAHYEVTGDQSLPVLLFSNSLGVDLSMWEPQLPALASRFCVLRYDTRGHGQSSIPIGPYSIEDIGGDVLGLLDAMNIQQVNFCGLSMGGVIGQWLGVNAPDRLHKLVLANTAAKIGTVETWDKRIETVLEDGLGSVIPGTLERWFTPEFRAAQPQTIARIATMLHAMNGLGYAACCVAVRDADFRATIGCITTPTLVITGAHDPVTTPKDGQLLAENIAEARYVELPAAHLSSVEAAGEFNAALLDFLRP